NAFECAQCVSSSQVPGSTDHRCNATCTGGVCYRLEYTMKHLAEVPNDITAIMDCMEYSVGTLTTGCRRNFQGIVLCVWCVLE
ncbi:hypothetical protein PFISCL1PPCAC_13011, partial [Pristionchus fissidentatus]